MAKAITIHRALISCWDKTGIADLCRVLREYGVEILSSGGTAEYLLQEQLPVTRVEEVTGFKEILDGRVKTLHPFIHGAILAKRTSEHLAQLAQYQIQPIDLVVVNLYPFLESLHTEKLLPDMVEMIDIGGPAMLRAAAKNYENVAVLHHRSQYPEFLNLLRANQGAIPLDINFRWASDLFFYTAYYDSQISRYFDSLYRKSVLPDRIALFYEKKQDLRYGENPHQSAVLYQPYHSGRESQHNLVQLWGKEMSYNNFVDVMAAAALVAEFEEPAVAIIKHTNPCGAAIDEALVTAFEKARAGDPVSAFGGIVACNQVVDLPAAGKIQETFFECLIAPDYEDNALEVLKNKKNLRILKALPPAESENQFEFRPLATGLLAQEFDRISHDPQRVRSVGVRPPQADEERDLYFAWKIVKHVKSNGIVFAKNLQVIGVGAGQMSRVDSVKLARAKALEHGHNLKGAIMASDAFFPFPDGIEQAAEAGITAVIQPGGSMRDPEVIEAAKKYHMAMLLTEIRHFKH